MQLPGLCFVANMFFVRSVALSFSHDFLLLLNHQMAVTVCAVTVLLLLSFVTMVKSTDQML